MALELRENISFRPFHTFGLKVRARYLMIVKTEDELLEALELPLVRKELKLILGGGSNLLPTRDIDGLVLKVDIRGKEEIPGKDQINVWVRSKAGENWHQLVLWTLQNGWGGLENLSLIPGNVGT
ncbi:MAG: FAD-binding protein, partial [Bacteroidota bacterium]|nr:FAD-binding protein [Bacteroidota bacterium]